MWSARNIIFIRSISVVLGERALLSKIMTPETPGKQRLMYTAVSCKIHGYVTESIATPYSYMNSLENVFRWIMSSYPLHLMLLVPSLIDVSFNV